MSTPRPPAPACAEDAGPDALPVCRICGNREGNRRHQAREMMFGTREPFDYLECAGCRCLQLVEVPEDLGRYYPHDYYAYQPSGAAASWKQRLWDARDRFVVLGQGLTGRLVAGRFPAVELEPVAGLGLQEGSRVLDVGCGGGYLLHRLHRAGMRNLRGVDPYATGSSEGAAGPRITRQRLDEVTGEWDWVMFHHSFEHVPDPLETLRAAACLLARGGTCLIRIPTVSSEAWEQYGVDWVQLDAPRHLFLHSLESMERLAREAGLVVREVQFDSTAFQFWGSEQYRADIPLRDPRSYAVDPGASIFTAESLALFATRARELNAARRGDQAAFHLARP